MENNTRRRLDDGSGRTCLPNGTKIGKYTVKYLATGGMSVVYCGTCLDKEYVLKEVDASNTIDVPSLMSEKSLLERLDHPGLVSYVEMFNENGFYYLVVEYVPGEPLSEWINSDRLASVDQVVSWGGQLAETFAYLHSRQPAIIYRDLKPGNVLLSDGKIRLIDFGIARLHKGHRHKDTALFGSALTASPEHYGRSETDTRSDIFTLGMTLYVLLTGGKKVKESAFGLVPVKQLREEVPDSLNDVIAKAIQLEPEDRFQTMMDFRQALYASLNIDVPALVKEHNSAELQADSSTQAMGTSKLEQKSSSLPAMMAVMVAMALLIGFAFVSGTGKVDPVNAAAGLTVEAKEMPDKAKEMADKADPHAGHNHAPGEGDHDEETENPYGGTRAGLEALNIPGDIFAAGRVEDKDVVMLGEDVGLFQVTGWGEQNSVERAETLAGRLNGFYHQFCPICGKSKLEPSDIRVGRHVETKDIVVFFAHAHDDGAVFAGPLLLATVTESQAETAQISPRFLASFWRDLLRDTVQVSRGLGSHHTVLGENLESALIRARDKVRLGEVSTANLKEVLQGVTGKEAFKLRKTFLEAPDRPPTHDDFSGLEGYEPLKV